MNCIPNDVLSLITKKCAYFDTFEMGLTRHLKKWERETLESLCGSVSYRRHDAGFLIPNSEGLHVKVPAKIKLDQPTREALTWFIDRLRDTSTDVFLWRVEASLDLITRSKSDALKVHHYLDAHIHKRGRGGAKKLKVIDGPDGLTTYIGRRGRPNQVVIYSGLPSKVIPEMPCCHVEWRAVSSRSVRAINLSTLQRLFTFSHRALWRKKLRLFELDMDAVGKRLRGKHGNSRSEVTYSGNTAVSKAANYARLCLYFRAKARGDLSNKHLVGQLNLLGDVKKVERLLRPIDASPLLPLVWGFMNAPNPGAVPLRE